MYILAFLTIPAVLAYFACKTDKYLLKSLQTLACLVIVMVAGLISGNIHFMYLAVSFLVSVAGDYFLSYKNRDKNYFVYGIALYFLAHIGYLLYIVMSFDVNIIVFLVAAALLLGGYLAYYFIALVKNIKGVMSVAVLAYLVISCAVLALAISAQAAVFIKMLMALGIALIVISDTIIAEVNFLSHKRLDFLVLPTYYAAQIFLSASFVIANFA